MNLKKISLFVLIFLTSLILISCINNEKSPVTKYSVEFNTMGGSYIETKEVESGKKVDRPPSEPKKNNYNFKNWYEEELGTTRFDFNKPIVKDTVIYAVWEELNTSKDEINVTFNSNGGSSVEEIKIIVGNKIKIPTEPIKKDFIFDGWYIDVSLETVFNFNNILNESITLYAKWKPVDIINTHQVRIHGGTINGETSFYFKSNVEFILNTPTHELGYEFAGWYTDAELTKPFVKPKYLTDDLDLYAKFNQPELEVQFESGSYLESLWAVYSDNAPIEKVEYKKSTESVWTLVDEELVRVDKGIYRIDVVGLEKGYYDLKITTEVEDKLSEHIYVEEHDRSGYGHFKYDLGVGAYNDNGTLKEDAIVVYVTEENKNNITIPGIGQVGLGWILNNAQYGSNDKQSYDLNAYNKSLAKFNKPIVFRIIGTVTTPEGATIRDSLENGGSKGDNGHMVRMKDAKDITIEGIGEDAVMLGWGMHFMASSIGRGVSFEVRNITFDKYPEDAVGMEGVQSGSTLTAPVERGWIHNNTFLQGYAANPAESDKGFGDGSLDIKRGQYFTISYNQFLETKKTNLVGASDNNLQYHITYHHNYWRNVDSRVPLARQANIHMYNNVFETTDDNQGQNSYVQNTRANSYIYSEANYFVASKAPSRVDSGAIKSYGDVKYSTYEKDGATTVTSREEKVKSGNKFEDFDTNPNVFYYDSVNKKSDVKRLTDAVTARLEVYAFSGVNNSKAKTNKELLKVTKMTPTLIDKEVNYGATKITKGSPFLVFEVLSTAVVELNSTNKVPAVLVDIYGRRLITGIGTVTIEPGIYLIESSIAHGASKGTSQAKDSSIDSLKITVDERTDQEKIQAVNNLINLIPEIIKYEKPHLNTINDAINAYNRLSADLQVQVDLSKVNSALTTYNELGKTYIESLINNIGVVSTSSGNKIALARNAYNEATTTIKTIVTNYDVLIAAENAFEAFEIEYINDAIVKLNDLLTISQMSLEEVLEHLIAYENIYQLYLGLSDEKHNQVVNIKKVTDGINVLEEVVIADDLNTLITEFDLINETPDNYNLINTIYTNVNKLSSNAKTFISSDNLTKLDDMYELYLEYLEQVNVEFYHYEGNNPFFKSIGESNSGGKISKTYNYDGVEINRTLKVESKTNLTFSSNKKMNVFIQLDNDLGLKINGINCNPDENNVIEITLEAGDVSIQRISGQPLIVYIVVTEGVN